VGIIFLIRIAYQNFNVKQLIRGILGAAAAGLVIGMLIAPEKGVDLRKNLKATADDWVDELSNWVGKGKEYIDEVRNRASEEVSNLQNSAEEGVDDMKDDLARRRA
jgi:gas vesicle protein